MSLTITRRKSFMEETTETINAPKHFSCFTSKGNRRLHSLANTLLNKVEKAISIKDEDSVKYIVDVTKALASYVKKYGDLCDLETYYDDGMSDTAVRECVGGFMDDVCEAIGHRELGDVIWNTVRY